MKTTSETLARIESIISLLDDPTKSKSEIQEELRTFKKQIESMIAWYEQRANDQNQQLVSYRQGLAQRRK